MVLLTLLNSSNNISEGCEKCFWITFAYLQENGMAQNTTISYMNDIKSFFKEMNLQVDDYVTAVIFENGLAKC